MTDLTVENINKLTVPKLKELAAEHFEPEEYKGFKKAQLQQLLIDYIERLDEEEDDDEEDDEGMDTVEAAAALLTEEDDDEEDDEEDDLPEEPAADLKERETYTAKQVATRIGTDAKTLRKFFRSPASTFEPVGQGGRYEFDAADLPGIKAEFEAWNSKKVTRSTKKREKPEPVREVVEEEEDDIELDDDPEANFDFDDAELDDIELDD